MDAHDITNGGHYEKSLCSDNDRAFLVIGDNLLGLGCAIRQIINTISCPEILAIPLSLLFSIVIVFVFVFKGLK